MGGPHCANFHEAESFSNQSLSNSSSPALFLLHVANRVENPLRATKKAADVKARLQMFGCPAGKQATLVCA